MEAEIKKNAAQAGVLGTAITAAVLLKDWVMTFPWYGQIGIVVGFIFLLFSAFYFVAIAKKKWGIDPSDMVKELKEILDVLRGAEIAESLSSPSVNINMTPKLDNGVDFVDGEYVVTNVELAKKFVVVAAPPYGAVQFKYFDSKGTCVYNKQARYNTLDGRIYSLVPDPFTFVYAPGGKALAMQNWTVIYDNNKPCEKFLDIYEDKALYALMPLYDQIDVPLRKQILFNILNQPKDAQQAQVAKFFEQVSGYKPPLTN